MWVYDVLCCCVRCADWNLLSLVDTIVCGCTTCCVAACDVLTDSGAPCKEWLRCVLLSQCILMVPTISVPGTSTTQVHQRVPYLNVPGTYYLSWMLLSCVRVRRVVLLRAMCWLIPVPRERNAKGACCSHLLIMVPTTTRVPGTGVDGRAIHGPSYRCRRT